MSILPPTPYDWLAAVVDASGTVVATAVLLNHNEGLVPETALDAGEGCELRFAEGFTKRAQMRRRALGMALINTGGETGPRQAPIASRVAASLAGTCTLVCFNRRSELVEVSGVIAAGGAAITVEAGPDDVLPGAAVLLADAGLVAVVRERTGPNGVLIANIGELLPEVWQPSNQAASKGGAEYAQVQSEAPDEPGPLPYTDSTRTAYSLAVAIGASRPGGLPPTDAGLLLLGLLVAGRGPLAGEMVPRALFEQLAEPRDERLAEAMASASSRAGLADLAADPVPGGQPFAGSEEVVAAAEAAARAAGATAIAMAHYAPAVVAAEIDEDVLQALGVTAEQLRACVEQALSDERGTVLAGPFASDQLTADEEPGDELGTKVYATMLATLIAKSGTPMPISIGLFGEWGSGKSYFMELLRREVKRLSELGEPYVHEIVQLTFNAWHYSDTNLWASLGAEFFEQLLGPEADPEEARRDALRKDLAESQQLAVELTSAQKAAVAKAGELREKLQSASQQREVKAREWDARVLQRVVADKGIRAQLAPVGKRLGLGDQVESVVGLARDVDGLRSDVAAVGQVLLHRRWRWTLVVVLVATMAAAAAVVASDQVAEWLSGGSVLAFGAAVGMVGRAVAVARGALTPLRAAAAKARALEEEMRTAPAGKQEKQLVDDLREQEAKAAVLGAQLADTVARAAVLDRELAELHPGRRLYRFIADRVSSADYRGQLGIVSTVRHDFEELSRLMKKAWPEKELAPGVQPIERIVLYIDDLDRCEPHQVVAVLQAVHLLMAMDLFVVVVGVDPRWLLRSLRRQYRGVMGAAPGVDGFWASTPQNYLEKIFQIPFVLPGMGADGFDQLMRSLAKPKPRTGASPSGDRPSQEQEGAAVDLGGPPAGGVPSGGGAQDQPSDQLVATPGSEIASVTPGGGGSPARPPAPTARDLIEDELKFLALLSDLVATPRAAKRLFNIYGLLRSTSDVWPGSSFLGDHETPGEYQAVAQLLAILAWRPELLGTLMWGRRADGSVETKALCRRPPAGTMWADFIDRLDPRQSQGRWENDVADVLAPEEVVQWRELVSMLQRIRPQVKLTDLEVYRHWAPKIARFSFVLSPFADDEPELAAPDGTPPAPNANVVQQVAPS